MPCNDWVVHTTTSGNIYIYIYIYIHRVYGAYLVQFTAGMAYPLARACSNRLYKSSPVTTPAGTISLKDAMILSCLYDDNNIEVQIGLELFIQHDERNLFSKEERRKKHCSVGCVEKDPNIRVYCRICCVARWRKCNWTGVGSLSTDGDTNPYDVNSSKSDWLIDWSTDLWWMMNNERWTTYW